MAVSPSLSLSLSVTRLFVGKLIKARETDRVSELDGYFKRQKPSDWLSIISHPAAFSVTFLAFSVTFLAFSVTFLPFSTVVKVEFYSGVLVGCFFLERRIFVQFHAASLGD